MPPYNPFSTRFIRESLKQAGLWLSKNRGQNYLIDKTIAEKITDLISEGAPVFEVGTGLGALTGLLFEKHDLLSVEIDRGIVALLRLYLPELSDKLVHDDFLKMPLDFPHKNTWLVSNLPYSISGEAMRRFIDCEGFEHAMLMLQKEFIERMNAPVGTKNYGLLSVISQLFLDIRPEFNVPKTAFFPAPSVDSVVVSISKKHPAISQNTLRDFLRLAFQAKRKTLANNLKKCGFDKKDIEKHGLNPSSRPQEIVPEKWMELALDDLTKKQK